MLHAVDGQLAELNQLLGAHHAATAETAQSALLSEAVSTLTALRSQIETAHSPLQLAALRVTMASAVQSASTAVASVNSNATAQQQMAAKLYDTRMTAAERGMAEISRRDDVFFASADARAEQLGLDVGFFRNQRSLLEAEAEAARKRGDRFGAMVPEGLLAHNTANLLNDIADQTGLPEDRRKAEAGRKLAEEADRKVREAAQAEAARAAANRPFGSDAERDRWISNDASQRFQKYQDRVDALHQSGPRQQEGRDKLASRSAALADELRDDAANVQPKPADDRLTAALPAAVREAANEAVHPLARNASAAEANSDHKPAPVTPLVKTAAAKSPGSSVTL